MHVLIVGGGDGDGDATIDTATTTASPASATAIMPATTPQLAPGGSAGKKLVELQRT